MSGQDLIQRIRRKVKDFPAVFIVVDAVNDTDITTTIQMQTGVTARVFPTPGQTFEWNDGTDERAQVIGVDPVNDQATVVRAVDGTVESAHDACAQAYIEPRFSYADCIDELNNITHTQLWPYVWRQGETQIPYQSANEYFSPTQTDIEQISYVYQISGGILWPLQFTWLPRELVADVQFPNGALIIPQTMDSSPLYVAFRMRPGQLDSLTPELEILAIDGATARLLMNDEAAAVGGDRSVIEGAVPVGSRLRASAFRWQQFELSRARLSALMNAEEQRRRAGS